MTAQQNDIFATESVKVLLLRGFALKTKRCPETHMTILKNHVFNLLQLLRHEPKLKDKFWYNSFKHRVYLKETKDGVSRDVALEDYHVSRLRVYCIDRWDVDFSKNACWEAIELAAREREKNPILDYIKEEIAGLVDDSWIEKNRSTKYCIKNHIDPKNNCQKDCKGHTPLEMWLTEYVGCNDTKINRVYSKKTLIGAVARLHATLENPVKMELMLVLYGEQGIYKSTLLSLLAFGWKFGREYFGDSAFSMKKRTNAIQMITGKIIYEIKELANRTNDEEEKAFIDEQIDEGRLPYDRKPRRFARTAIMIGTTNKSYNILRDATGDRRFAVVSCNQKYDDKTQKMKYEEFEKNVMMLWAEAYYWYTKKTGQYDWWFSKEEEDLQRDANQSYVSEHPLQDLILEKAEDIRVEKGFVKVKDVIAALYKEEGRIIDGRIQECKKWLDKNTRKNQAIIADCLHRDGYRYTRKRPPFCKHQVRGWFK
jgi:predicted P-loop ATPase